MVGVGDREIEVPPETQIPRAKEEPKLCWDGQAAEAPPGCSLPGP